MVPSAPTVIIDSQNPSLLSAHLTAMGKLPMNSPLQLSTPPTYKSTPVTSGTQNSKALVFTGMFDSRRRTSSSSSDQSLQQQTGKLSMLSKNFSRRHFEIFSQKIGFCISCKLSPEKTICMKCQRLYYWEKQENIISLSSAEFTHRVVKAKGTGYSR